jgi:hypothetical protein
MKKKSSTNEKILADIWPQYFNKDLVEMLGGAGSEDFLVTPYLNNGLSGYGDRISIERKSGKQTYTGAHFKEAIRHSIEKGATYAIIIYDTQDNPPQKTMFARGRKRRTSCSRRHSIWNLENGSGDIRGATKGNNFEEKNCQ